MSESREEVALRRAAKLGFRPEADEAAWAVTEIDRLRSRLGAARDAALFYEKSPIDVRNDPDSWGRLRAFIDLVLSSPNTGDESK